MKQLFLLRHAKSGWGDATLRDFDRPLNERGRDAIARMARFMQAEALIPDMIYCSPAARTRETLERFMAATGIDTDILYMDGLYGASQEILSHIVRKTAETCHNLMVISHSPGIHDFALSLVGRDPNGQGAALMQKYPTAALSVFRFDDLCWADVKSGSGNLQRFIGPKDI